MLSIICFTLTIKLKVGIPDSFKVGWYPPPPKKTGSSHLKYIFTNLFVMVIEFDLLALLQTHKTGASPLGLAIKIY